MFCSLVDTSKIPSHGIYCFSTPFGRIEIQSITLPGLICVKCYLMDKQRANLQPSACKSSRLFERNLRGSAHFIREEGVLIIDRKMRFSFQRSLSGTAVAL